MVAITKKQISQSIDNNQVIINLVTALEHIALEIKIEIEMSDIDTNNSQDKTGNCMCEAD